MAAAGGSGCRSCGGYRAFNGPDGSGGGGGDTRFRRVAQSFTPLAMACPAEKPGDFKGLRFFGRSRPDEFHHRLPRPQHGREVGGEIFRVLAAQELENFFVGEVPDDQGGTRQVSPTRRLDAVVAEGDLVAEAVLAAQSVTPFIVACPAKEPNDFNRLRVCAGHRRKTDRRFPRAQHCQEVGVVVLQVLATQELKHLLVGQVSDDHGYTGQIGPPGSLDAVVTEGDLIPIAALSGDMERYGHPGPHGGEDGRARRFRARQLIDRADGG